MKSGFIAIVGEANAGKSTLLNAILGRKISIVSSKAHTTRNRILGISRSENAELVFVDTPGFPPLTSRSRSMRGGLARSLQRTLQEAAQEVDIVLLVVDATRVAKEDGNVTKVENTAKSLRSSLRSRNIRQPDLIVLNKVDLVRKDLLLPAIDAFYRVFSEEPIQAENSSSDAASHSRRPAPEIIPLSALKEVNTPSNEGDKSGIQFLLRALTNRLPEGEALFPAEIDTDQTEQFFVSEIIREKLFHNLHEELPHSVAVGIEAWKDDDKRLTIDAVILVEREAHKPIVLGKGGQMIKKVGETARREIEHRFQVPVVLRLFVRVEENWSRNEITLRRIGL